MRSLTEEEIITLQEQGCSAEDWTAINVGEDFEAAYIQNTSFYGDITLGVFEKNIEIEEGFAKHSGIRNAVLKDVTIGDNCLIEGVHNFICNYEIGEECYISNVGRICTTNDATFGEGNLVSVQNEGGDGNVIIFDALTSQLAAFMILHASDKELSEALRNSIRAYISNQKPERGVIGYRVKIVNTTDISNTIIMDDCEVSGASRISDCTFMSTSEASTFIGNDVIIDSTIVQSGSSVLDGAKVDNCFVGEACHIGKGASAEASLFFANSYLDNGETCAAFCGPFTVSHHKSSLLIGGAYSFYNAGSNTNFSNHAYKMGPIHWGTMERGSKTASGAHILWPATIGTFSMCMGKIQSHPHVEALPFSYIFGVGDATYLVPGRNLTTVGTWRDIKKWPKRDMRPRIGRQSIVNYDWLSPLVVLECIKGRTLLEQLRKEQGENVASYTYNGCTIRNESLQRGIKLYSMAIRLYIYQALCECKEVGLPSTSIGTGEWIDLSGMYLPDTEERQLVNEIKDGNLSDINDIAEKFQEIHQDYATYRWAFTYRVICNICNLEQLTQEDADRIKAQCEPTYTEWLNAIKYDAEKEFQMGDVAEEELNSFLEGIR